jgi:hypothetical protein
MTTKQKVILRITIATLVIVVSSLIVVFYTTLSDKVSLIAVIATGVIIISSLSIFAVTYEGKKQ